jgi:hypothetical protein
MCCFAGPVVSVDNTRIFARLSDGGSQDAPAKQLLAYQMTYKSERPNAMILPIPAVLDAEESSIRFIDLSTYEDFFADLRRGFPGKHRAGILSRTLPSAAVESQVIEVHEVGKFIASFVPKVNDFARLDQRFVIPKEVWAQIPEYDDYSFAVFQLSNLEGEVHPIAFEFATRLPETIFFPTIHIHDGEVHSTEHFSHELYAQHPAFDKLTSWSYTAEPDAKTKLVRSEGPASKFMDLEKSQGMVDGRRLVHRKIMRGNLPNQDVLLGTKPAATISTLGSVNYQILGTAAALLPLAWLINRRNKLRKQKKQELIRRSETPSRMS